MKYLFIDTETTSVDTVNAGLTQLSGFIVIDNKVVECFDVKVTPRPDAPIEQGALDACHLTLEDLKDSTRISEDNAYVFIDKLMNKYVKKFDKKDKLMVCGYNVKFDIEILYNLYLRHSNNFLFSLIWGNYLDVMVLATYRLLSYRKDMLNFKQGTVAQKFGIELKEDRLHDSFYDIVVCYKIYEKVTGESFMWLKDYLKIDNSNINESYLTNEELPYEMAIKQCITFGKHNGKTIQEVMQTDPQYIKWLHSVNSSLITEQMIENLS